MLLVLVQRLVQRLARARNVTWLLRDMNVHPRQRLQTGGPFHQRANGRHHLEINNLGTVKKAEAGEILARRSFISGDQLARRVEWRRFCKLLLDESAADHRVNIDSFVSASRLALSKFFPQNARNV